MESASSNRARATGKASASSLPIPTDCAPCPGNNKANGCVTDLFPIADFGFGIYPIRNRKSEIRNLLLPTDDCGAPGQTGAEDDQQNIVPLLDAARLDRLAEGDNG